METTNKKRLLIGVIILLLVINISAIATLLYTNNIKQKRYEDIRKTREQVEVDGMHRFLKDELRLTDEQFQVFREAGKKYFKQNRAIAQQLDNKRIEFINELTSENPDISKLDKISKEIGELHYNLKLNTVNHYFDLKKICNPDQQEILDKLFMRMIQTEDHRPMNHKERARKMGNNPRFHND